MKVFISQPMRGLKSGQIASTRDEAMRKIVHKYPGTSFISSLIDEGDDDFPKDANPVWYLGRSIQLLSKADAIYFCEGWENARGCLIERQVAESYDIWIVTDEELERKNQ